MEPTLPVHRRIKPGQSSWLNYNSSGFVAQVATCDKAEALFESTSFISQQSRITAASAVYVIITHTAKTLELHIMLSNERAAQRVISDGVVQGQAGQGMT